MYIIAMYYWDLLGILRINYWHLTQYRKQMKIFLTSVKMMYDSKKAESKVSRFFLLTQAYGQYCSESKCHL